MVMQKQGIYIYRVDKSGHVQQLILQRPAKTHTFKAANQLNSPSLFSSHNSGRSQPASARARSPPERTARSLSSLGVLPRSGVPHRLPAAYRPAPISTSTPSAASAPLPSPFGSPTPPPSSCARHTRPPCAARAPAARPAAAPAQPARAVSSRQVRGYGGIACGTGVRGCLRGSGGACMLLNIWTGRLLVFKAGRAWLVQNSRSHYGCSMSMCVAWLRDDAYRRAPSVIASRDDVLLWEDRVVLFVRVADPSEDLELIYAAGEIGTSLSLLWFSTSSYAGGGAELPVRCTDGINDRWRLLSLSPIIVEL
ncbi:hypothetical protein CALCODRAFT_154003 [Calocera cornea HHB12733]|uniref:Uncharacterized protein n=1 Tax=Calocera cornea HHB12733 TaxID=1353952 RepID=A0A165CM46_9BASI|nr:hypothetical protein CALCODRAFT_154003 [Calocera cornea HHB12733]